MRCPFCPGQYGKNWSRHVAGHMEEMALRVLSFVLASDDHQDATSDDCDSDSLNGDWREPSGVDSSTRSSDENKNGSVDKGIHATWL